MSALIPNWWCKKEQTSGWVIRGSRWYSCLSVCLSVQTTGMLLASWSVQITTYLLLFGFVGCQRLEPPTYWATAVKWRAEKMCVYPSRKLTRGWVATIYRYPKFSRIPEHM